MRTILLTAMLLAAPLALAPALAQTPQSGEAAPKSPPSGVSTPAPVPESAPGVPATTSPAVVPEMIAPPAGTTAGPANATPFSNVPSGVGGNPPGGSGAPNLSK